jgi:hypothetical protein
MWVDVIEIHTIVAQSTFAQTGWADEQWVLNYFSKMSKFEIKNRIFILEKFGKNLKKKI